MEKVLEHLTALMAVLDTNALLSLLVNASSSLLMPLMFWVWCGALALRWLIYFTVRCEYKFVVEFEKRVYKHLTHENLEEARMPFHTLTELLLQRTYYEHFELKRKYMRRRFDYISSLSDRIFLIQEGAARLTRDILKQTQYMNRSMSRPKFQAITQYVVSANPVFNKIWGIVPVGLANDLLNILPGLFVIGGIFGTFLGVMQALPQLANISLADVEGTKVTMDKFLLNMSFAMITSIVGIIYSVSMTILNTAMSPDSSYLNLVNKLTSSLEFLWNDTDPSLWQEGKRSENYFDVVRDPLLGAHITQAPSVPVVAAKQGAEENDNRAAPPPASPVRWNQSDVVANPFETKLGLQAPPPATRESKPERRPDAPADGDKKPDGGSSEAA